MVLYTSGTTGRPKGVLHSHNSIHALICQIRDHWNVDPGDTFLVPSPIAHIGGSIYAFECPLLLGTTAVLMDRWDPAAAVALMDGERCTHMAGATPFLQQLLSAAAARRHPAARLEGVHLRRRLGVAVADPPRRRVFRPGGGHPRVRLHGSARHDRRRTPARRSRPRRRHRRAAGIAEIKLVAHEAAPAGDGEICVRGPQMLLGYRHPEDDVRLIRCRRVFPHRRSRALGR